MQGGLYLLAAEQWGTIPPAWSIAGSSATSTFAGWMTSSHYPEIKQACEPEQLAAVMQQAREDTLTAIAEIREGRIDPKPADEMKCDYCDFAHACRYEVAAMEQAKKAGQ